MNVDCRLVKVVIKIAGLVFDACCDAAYVSRDLQPATFYSSVRQTTR